MVLMLAAGGYAAVSGGEWHADQRLRAGAALVVATLVLWIGEAAPLGVTALAIPLIATFSGVLEWKQALTAFADRTVFLFLGAFLLARALDKHATFEPLTHGGWGRRCGGGSGLRLALLVLALAGALSTFQNNTAVSAMLLAAVGKLAAMTRLPALPLLALSYGATLGGMATPVGTAPNMIGFEEMKQHDASMNFLRWLSVGVPVWLGTSLLTWGVLALAARVAGRAGSGAARTSWIDGFVQTDVGPATLPAAAAHDAAELARQRQGRVWALLALLATVLLWLAPSLTNALLPDEHGVSKWVERFLHESIPPVAMAWLLFLIPSDRRGATVLDRHDFQALDWDTLFLIAGGLCLGRVMEDSGAARALAGLVSSVALQPWLLMLLLGGVTVLLSEITSNTATAALLVPVAAPLAPALGLTPVQAIWLVALCASLGFALPVSTPPNALVYATRRIPLRLMLVSGIVVDLLCLLCVVLCLRWFS